MFQHLPTVNLIKHYIPLTEDDQIIDIGGGTGEIIRLLRRDLGIKKPGVCIEPNHDMIGIAMKKDGVIPIESTAGDFLAVTPKYPMKIVLISSAVHHIRDLAGTFANLARYMPDDGICLVTQYPPPAKVWFEAGLKKFKGIENESFYRILESNHLQYKSFQWKEPVEMDKQFWYETLRSRYSSTLTYFTDEEIEEGIDELEMKFGADQTLKFDIVIEGCIITKKY